MRGCVAALLLAGVAHSAMADQLDDIKKAGRTVVLRLPWARRFQISPMQTCNLRVPMWTPLQRLRRTWA